MCNASSKIHADGIFPLQVFNIQRFRRSEKNLFGLRYWNAKHTTVTINLGGTEVEG
jgi:hypothetical protein